MTATESNEAPIISIQNVWKFFGQLTALHDVSFDVQPGERVVIIGPSGSGKSTLLRSINRLEVIDKGTILVEGSDINAPENDINKIRQDLGKYMVKITDARGKTQTNITMLPSAFFTIEKEKGQSYVLYGGGYGHGIGMSQYGADGMASRGSTYKEILEYYFPGITLTKSS